MTRLTPAQRELAGDPRHVRYALNRARRMSRSCPRRLAEMESSALWGLVRAAATFDPSRGVSFLTHATPRIVGEIVGGERTHSGHGHSGRPGHRGRSRHVRRTELLSSRELPVGWELESADAVGALCAYLSPGNRAVLLPLLTRCDAASQKAAARLLGLDPSRASQARSAALAHLRKVLRRRARAAHPERTTGGRSSP